MQDQNPRTDRLASLGFGFEIQQFARCEPGRFTMGSRYGVQDPLVEVTLTRPFLIQRTPVTVSQWVDVMGSLTNDIQRDERLPMVWVSWHDVRDFIGVLNSRTGKRFRLPSDAEWEYAARAGATGEYAGNYDDLVVGRSDDETDVSVPVASRHPNRWGIFDMHGNVWEWCEDWWEIGDSTPRADPRGPQSGSARVTRGGPDYNGETSHGYTSQRGCEDPSDRLFNVGFRLVLNV